MTVIFFVCMVLYFWWIGYSFASGGERREAIWDTLKLPIVYIDNSLVSSFIELAGFYANTIYYLTKQDIEEGMPECIGRNYDYPVFFIEFRVMDSAVCKVFIHVSGFEGGRIEEKGDSIVRYLVNPRLMPVYAVLSGGSIGIILVERGLDTVSCFRAVGLRVFAANQAYVLFPVRYEKVSSWPAYVNGDHLCFLVELALTGAQSCLESFFAIPLHLYRK